MANVCGLPQQLSTNWQLLQQFVEVGVVVLQRLRLIEVKLDLALGFSDCLHPWEGSLEPISKQGQGGLLPSRQSSSVPNRVVGKSCSSVGEVSPSCNRPPPQ